MTEKRIRYGIISTASIVSRFVNGMRLSGNGEVSAISSRSLSKGEKLAGELNIPKVYTDYRDLLNDPDIDAVYIPLINSLHYPFAKEALLAGKHAIVEKPFVLHAKEAEELFSLAEEKGLFITEAIKTPFLPLYAEVKKIIDTGIYGNIQYMTFRQSYTGGSYISGWNRQKEYGGGVLYGNEAYFFRMAEFLGGKIISCTGSISGPREEAEDQCSLSALTEKGILASLSVSTRVLFDNGLTIYLDGARIDIPDYWKASEALIRPLEGEEKRLKYDCPYELRYELEHYNDCILKHMNSSSVNTPENTVRYISFCEDIYRSCGDER